MRLSTGEDRDEERALATIAAAVDAGVTVFDTARSYDDNERLLARALRGVEGARVVTKGGMSRAGGGWVPDGRAKAIRADCEASLEALDGLPIDLYLCTPRSAHTVGDVVRALARLLDDGPRAAHRPRERQPAHFSTRRSSWRNWLGGACHVQFIAGYQLLSTLPYDLERAANMLVKRNYYGKTRDPSVRSESIPGVMSVDYSSGAAVAAVNIEGTELGQLLAPYKLPAYG